jgi:hypothetical protein
VTSKGFSRPVGTSMVFYFKDKDLVNDVLYKKDVSRATIKGRAYIFRGIVEAKWG